MKHKFIGLVIILALFFICSSGYSQYDSLIVAPEVLFNGAPPPADMFFKPGRIIDENAIWFCGYIGSIFGDETYVFRSVDGGNTFTHNATAIGSDTRAGQMDAFNADTALVAMDNGEIYRTTDGGVTWNLVYSYTAAGNEWFDGCRVLNDNVAIAYGDGEFNGDMHFCRTDDKGATWTEITTINYMGAIYGYFTWGLAACNVGETIWCSGTDSGYDSSYVFRSYDAGVTWDTYKIPVAVIPNYPRAISFTDDNNGLIAARGGYLIKSTDGGATWSTTNNPDPSPSSCPNGVTAIPNTNIIVALDDIGVYYTSDLGTTWDQIATPDTTASDYIVSGVFLNPNFGYVFTYNGLVLRFADQLSAISDPNTGQSPEEFHLAQNYPNPFNPVTTIEFNLPATQYTELKVYNLLGTEVATLVAGKLNKGNHTYQFDGSNLASSVYYYQLNSGNVREVKKMVLLK